MYYSFFIFSSVDGHLDCFCFLTTVSDAAMNMGVQISLLDTDLFPSNIYLEGVLLDDILVLFSIFKELLYHFP